ncbi:hypothetical protein C7M84_019226 [Penaeus vannamei]|uniref:Uncharacterized protein n=1 Tax=Penaeus vannamei TaxID=6689 RepID=A0A3R7LU16_PENVA|nr:hypothetical protein C7M84_019226 [Penaeus vannamei]
MEEHIHVCSLLRPFAQCHSLLLGVSGRVASKTNEADKKKQSQTNIDKRPNERERERQTERQRELETGKHPKRDTQAGDFLLANRYRGNADKPILGAPSHRHVVESALEKFASDEAEKLALGTHAGDECIAKPIPQAKNPRIRRWNFKQGLRELQGLPFSLSPSWGGGLNIPPLTSFLPSPSPITFPSAPYTLCPHPTPPSPHLHPLHTTTFPPPTLSPHPLPLFTYNTFLTPPSLPSPTTLSTPTHSSFPYPFPPPTYQLITPPLPLHLPPCHPPPTNLITPPTPSSPTPFPPPTYQLITPPTPSSTIALSPSTSSSPTAWSPHPLPIYLLPSQSPPTTLSPHPPPSSPTPFPPPPTTFSPHPLPLHLPRPPYPRTGEPQSARSAYPTGKRVQSTQVTSI